MNTKFGQSNLKLFVTLNCEDLEFSLKACPWRPANFDASPETGSCYNSGMQCPICTKLHMFDKTPDLKRST